MIDDMDVAYFRRAKRGWYPRSFKTTEPVQAPIEFGKSCAIGALAVVVQTVSLHVNQGIVLTSQIHSASIHRTSNSGCEEPERNGLSSCESRPANRCHRVGKGCEEVSPPESFMMRLAIATHASQIWTFGPATSFEASAALFPQKEQASEVFKDIINLL